MVVFLKNMLNSCQNGSNRVNVVVFGKSCCNRTKWWYSGKSGGIQRKVVVFGHSGCSRAKVVVMGQGGYIRAKWLYSGN